MSKSTRNPIYTRSWTANFYRATAIVKELKQIQYLIDKYTKP